MRGRGIGKKSRDSTIDSRNDGVNGTETFSLAGFLRAGESPGDFPWGWGLVLLFRGRRVEEV